MVTNWPINRGGSASNVLQPWNAKLASSLAILRRGRYDTINETNLKMLSKKKCRRRSREFISKLDFLFTFTFFEIHTHGLHIMDHRERSIWSWCYQKAAAFLIGRCKYCTRTWTHGHIGVSNGHKESVSITDANTRVSWSGNDILHDWQTTYPTLSSHQPHGVVV